MADIDDVLSGHGLSGKFKQLLAARIRVADLAQDIALLGGDDGDHGEYQDGVPGCTSPR